MFDSVVGVNKFEITISMKKLKVNFGAGIFSSLAKWENSQMTVAST